MIRETITIRRDLWLVLRRHLIGDYGNLNSDCEVILLKDPMIHIVACAEGDTVNVTLTYEPLEVARDVRRSRALSRGASSIRNKLSLILPLT